MGPPRNRTGVADAAEEACSFGDPDGGAATAITGRQCPAVDDAAGEGAAAADDDGGAVTAGNHAAAGIEYAAGKSRHATNIDADTSGDCAGVAKAAGKGLAGNEHRRGGAGNFACTVDGDAVARDDGAVIVDGAVDGAAGKGDAADAASDRDRAGIDDAAAYGSHIVEPDAGKACRNAAGVGDVAAKGAADALKNDAALGCRDVAGIDDVAEKGADVDSNTGKARRNMPALVMPPETTLAIMSMP